MAPSLSRKIRRLRLWMTVEDKKVRYSFKKAVSTFHFFPPWRSIELAKHHPHLQSSHLYFSHSNLFIPILFTILLIVVCYRLFSKLHGRLLVFDFLFFYQLASQRDRARRNAGSAGPHARRMRSCRRRENARGDATVASKVSMKLITQLSQIYIQQFSNHQYCHASSKEIPIIMPSSI